MRPICVLALASAVCFASAAAAQAPPAPTPSASAQVVVSAAKVPEDDLDVAGTVQVVSGEDLRKRGARTLQDALQDVVGVEASGGSDNGARFPNLGMWGLKEFDALLVTVDGVPVGGPFNPSLAQIPIEEIDRIEIAKGPQGTLYGVSAFAGMVQVFTRRGTRSSVTLGLGSFNDRHASLSYEKHDGDLVTRLDGSTFRDHGFQDGAGSAVDRLSLGFGKKTRDGSWDLTLGILRDTSYWGSPLPVDGGQPVPGFDVDKNYAVGGARMDHRVYSLSASLSQKLSDRVKFENTLGLARDEQIAIRSFIDGVDGSTATANGTSLRPVETSLFDDARFVANLGTNRLVAGAALTWGRTTSSGTGFDLTLTTGPNPVVPNVDSLPVGDHRSAEDRRTFLGLYANDTWTPWPFLSLTAGARYDRTSESLSAVGQEVGSPAPDVAADSRTDGKWSGGASVLFRVVDQPSAGVLNALNLYVAAKSNFKPAAPNLLEAEAATILQPERTRSGEIGLKSRWAGGNLSFDASLFHMSFENLVVSVAGPDGLPMLTNAGEERFQGFETSLAWSPRSLRGLSLAAGYAHHDATYVRFSFTDPDGNLVVADGNRLELIPRDAWNVRLGYTPKAGFGAWAAVRHQGVRPLDPENTVSVPSFFEWDAGISWENDVMRLALTGRNLGDNRRYVTESEIGDSQFYVAPPRRLVGELTVRF